MKAGLAIAICLLGTVAAAADPPVRGDVLIVTGSPGTAEYAVQFEQWGSEWSAAARRGGWRVQEIGAGKNAGEDLQALRKGLESASREQVGPMWLVLIGHGTFDGRDARFNLPGPDLQSDELKQLLDKVQRPMAVIACFSASAPFLAPLAGEERVIMTSTASGSEGNYSRFGGFLAACIASPQADLDKDGQTSLLEAFLRASAETAAFYESEGRLATEHPQLDDNGDGRGVPDSGFAGLRPVHRNDPPGKLPDGFTAHQWHLVPSDLDAALTPEQLDRRNDLERELARLRSRKNLLSEDDYYAALESFALELARLLISTPRTEATEPLPDGRPSSIDLVTPAETPGSPD